MHRAISAYNNLVEGNRRFAAGKANSNNLSTEERRNQLLEGQAPSAVILGCSDSRAPAEIIFDQGLGELFVIRVAGNVVAPSGIGSIEYAVEQCGTRLIVVLGHSGCGAVQATVDELQRPQESRSPNLQSIVDRISPSVQPLLDADVTDDPVSLINHAVRANVRASVRALKRGSPIIERWIEEDYLFVVGANYSLETGLVEFFDNVPGAEDTSS
ncbi:MAG: carbonic anhydrase [Verrucomicrobiales bacterium]|nr:carbonic anhydrase [Verrucomicrobiales bacterium]